MKFRFFSSNGMSSRLALAVAAACVGMSASAAPSFVLPERLYALPGHECCVYYSNVFSSVVPRNYAFEAVACVGRAQAERWCWTPAATDAGREVELVLRAWNDDGVVAVATSRVQVAASPANPGRTARLALFADSLTNCGYQDELFRILRADGFSGYKPVGTRRGRAPGNVPHDGFGGYDCKAFLTTYSVSEDELANVQDAAERSQLAALGVPAKVVNEWQRELLKSPLVRLSDGKKTVDVRHWLLCASDGVPPDLVVVQLGVNAIFGVRGSAAEIRREILARVIPEFSAFLGALRPHMPNAVFGIVTSPIGSGQDGFAANYGASAGEVQHRISTFELNRALAEYVGALRDPCIELVPVAQAVDPVNGYPHAEESAGARTSAKTIRAKNALHPTQSGGFQMADAIAAWFECRWNDWEASK